MPKPLTLDSSTALLRDEFVPFAQANISIASSPVLYGLAIYTVFSANWNSSQNQLFVFKIREHYTRLVRAARIMDFQDFAARYSLDEFESLMLELLRRNEVRSDALVRVMVFVDELAAGTRIHGLKNSLAAYVAPIGEILPRTGVSAGVSSWQRTADNMIPARAKLNGSYINASLMKNEALAHGYDEAIALDTSGHVTEGTVANIFFVRDGALLTPSASGDILEGITRSTMISLAHELGLTCTERQIDRTELYTFDEAMFVGSSARITPILSIDRRPVGGGTIGPVTANLMRHYDDLLHGRLARQDLTPTYPVKEASPGSH